MKYTIKQARNKIIELCFHGEPPVTVDLYNNEIDSILSNIESPDTKAIDEIEKCCKSMRNFDPRPFNLILDIITKHRGEK